MTMLRTFTIRLLPHPHDPRQGEDQLSFALRVLADPTARGARRALASEAFRRYLAHGEDPRWAERIARLHERETIA